VKNGTKHYVLSKKYGHYKVWFINKHCCNIPLSTVYGYCIWCVPIFVFFQRKIDSENGARVLRLIYHKQMLVFIKQVQQWLLAIYNF